MIFAAAGAALATQRSRGPSGHWARRRGGLATLLLAGAAPLLVVFGALWLPAALACSSDERAVYEEFPQYGGRGVEPEGNPESGSCAAYYETPGSEEEVFAYFRGRLEENGWEERPAESWRAEGARYVPTELVYERGDFRYEVSVERVDPEAGGHAPGRTHVAAHVGHRDPGAVPPGVPPAATS